MRTPFATACLVLLLGGAAGAEELNLAEWTRRAPVILPIGGVKGLAEVALPAEVMDVSAANLGDLRLVYEDSIEAAYVVSRGAASPAEVIKPLPARLYNRVYEPSTSAAVTVDFGEQVVKNRIEVSTGGTNFRRKVRVEASDDGRDWRTVRDGAFLFRFEDGGVTPSRRKSLDTVGGGASERSAIDIPANDMRYIRVTVLNGPDDPERIEIDAVRAWHREHRRPPVEKVPVTSVRTAERAKATEIVLDLGVRNLPLYEIALSFSDDNFYRMVSVAGRNEETRAVVLPKEGGGTVTRTVDVPWAGIVRAPIWRVGGAANPADESVALDIRGAQYRHLKVTVENGDDRPLAFTGTQVVRRPTAIRFLPRPGGGSLWLYAGNASAHAPQYDLARYVDKIAREGAMQASLGPLGPNPLRAPPKEAPWSERHRWLVWAALVGAAVALALIIWGQARSSSSSPK